MPVLPSDAYSPLRGCFTCHLAPWKPLLLTLLGMQSSHASPRSLSLQCFRDKQNVAVPMWSVLEPEFKQTTSYLSQVSRKGIGKEMLSDKIYFVANILWILHASYTGIPDLSWAVSWAGMFSTSQILASGSKISCNL